MDTGFILPLIGILALLVLAALIANSFQASLGGIGIREILKKHPGGLTAAELLVWKEDHWAENADLYPNIPSDPEACTQLLNQLCDQGLVRSEGEGPERRYYFSPRQKEQ